MEKMSKVGRIQSVQALKVGQSQFQETTAARTMAARMQVVPLHLVQMAGQMESPEHQDQKAARNLVAVDRDSKAVRRLVGFHQVVKVDQMHLADQRLGSIRALLVAVGQMLTEQASVLG
jgi:hypothetical protein